MVTGGPRAAPTRRTSQRKASMLRATQGTGTDAAVDLVGSGPYARNAGTRFYYAGPVYQQPWSDGCVGFGARITRTPSVVPK